MAKSRPSMLTRTDLPAIDDPLAPIVLVAADEGGGGGGDSELAVSDFKNGIYSIGGVSKTLGDLWEENVDWSAYDQATVINGVGLTGEGSAPAATAALYAAITDGTGIVVKVDAVLSGTADGLSFEWFDSPSYAQEAFVQVLCNNPEGSPETGLKAHTFDALGEQETSALYAAGPIVFAISYSANAVTVRDSDGQSASASTSGVSVIANTFAISAGPSGAVVEKMTFYPAGTDLTALLA